MSQPWDNEPIDQLRLPWVSVHGLLLERVLRVEELEAWTIERKAACPQTHVGDIPCRWCVATERVAERMASGEPMLRLYPAR